MRCTKPGVDKAAAGRIQRAPSSSDTRSLLAVLLLQMCHHKVIDTVALYPHPRGLPYKSSLKFLATKFLKRSIQEGEHDSVVDARTAMDLALLKIEKGKLPVLKHHM